MRGLKMLLETMGLKIDPVAIEQAWEQSKDALPKLAKSFDEMNQQLLQLRQVQAGHSEMLVALMKKCVRDTEAGK